MTCQCAGSPVESDPEPSWLDAPGEMPATLEQTGLYAELSDLGSANQRALSYRPRHALWSNGSSKQRLLVLPEGERVDTSDRDAWRFPEGSLFFKTFSYPDEAATDGLRPIETRVLRKGEDGWQYYVYLWSDDRSTAELLDGTYTTPVEVEIDGERFEHVVPAKLDCRKCHESQPNAVIGFDELRLNGPRDDDAGETQLTELALAGLLSELPEDPERVQHPDARTERVLGYFHGNCAHCHNGWQGPSSAFDMRHPVALENLINVASTSELLTGVRVVPGSAEESSLYRAMSRNPELNDEAAMPPVGVERADQDALQLVRSWIDELDPEDWDD